MTTEHSDRECQVADSIIHRFIDGDLRDDERIAAAALLASDEASLTQAGDYQRQNVLLQALHPRRAEDVMLPAVGLNLAAALRRGRLFRRASASVVGVLVLVAAGTAGWQIQDVLRPTPQIVAVFPSAMPATAPAVTDSGATPAPVAMQPAPPPVATAIEVVAGGLPVPGSSQVPVHPPNLKDIGYQLVDGQADLTAYGPVIRFAYEPVDGHVGTRLALSVAALGVDRESLATTINPQQTSLFWHAGPLLYALTGDVDALSLVRVMEVVNAVESAPAVVEAPQLVETPPQQQVQPQPIVTPPTVPGVEQAVENPAESPALGVPAVVDGSEQPKDT